ncbi:MAG: trimeric intracellular cation channel family protein [Clostridiales bacterium]|nr:trimeric intracellular cation channel family protein [Clostridiales bacterium]
MNIFILVFEIIGTIAFAVSGAMTGLRKNMDIFGVCILGLTTAVGGGIIRDLILGITPPATFQDPMYALIAIGVSIIIFIPVVRRLLFTNRRAYELILLITDSAGLGIFTVYGVSTAVDAGFGGNFFLTVFVAVLTGVGGGVIRDLFARDRPYIFVKHIYACAALAGAILCALLWNAASRSVSMIAGFALVVLIRLLAAKFRWSLPKAKEFAE